MCPKIFIRVHVKLGSLTGQWLAKLLSPVYLALNEDICFRICKKGTNLLENFTPFVLRILSVYGHCKVSGGELFIYSSTVVSSLPLDFYLTSHTQRIPTINSKCLRGLSCTVNIRDSPRVSLTEQV